MKIIFLLILLLNKQAFALDCPFLIPNFNDDNNIFNELENYFKTFSENPACTQTKLIGLKTLSEIQTNFGERNTVEEKCLSRIVDQTVLRDLEKENVEKKIKNNSTSPYFECNQSKDAIFSDQEKRKILDCIDDKFHAIINIVPVVCSKMTADQNFEDKLLKGVGDLKDLLSKTLTANNLCKLRNQKTFQVVADTFSKSASVASILPAGAVAAIGVDLVGAVIDDYLPSDMEKAGLAMNAIVAENNFEKSSCLYFNIQQKMYCTDKPAGTSGADPNCERKNADADLVKLLENVETIKKTTNVGEHPDDLAKVPSISDTFFLEENIGDLTKYAKASAPDIRERIKKLPKVQQAKELEKINQFYHFLDQYENSDVEMVGGIEKSRMALEGLMPLLYSTEPGQKINFDYLVIKSTPGLKLEMVKQKGLISALNDLYVVNKEDGRAMARLNTFKNTINGIAPAQMLEQLAQNIDEFKKQMAQSLARGSVNSSGDIGDGLIRNIVRHCSLLQEIYDPQFEGKIPDQCAKFNCGNENRFNWYMGKNGPSSATEFKKSYCEKSLSYKKIEDKYVQELNDSTGAKMCGKKIGDYLEIKNI